ncbi:MAG TPA: hypothetical protein VIO60_03065 [Rectinemataceae bacterium]
MKRLLFAAAMALAASVLILAVGCDLDPPKDDYEPKENEVFVSVADPAAKSPIAKELGGRIVGDRNRALAPTTWAEVSVFSASGLPTGHADLAEKDGKWEGYVQVSEAGAMTFSVCGGAVANQVTWVGSGTLTVSGTGQNLAIQADIPAIGDMGPAGGLIFHDKGSYSDGWRYLEASPVESSGYLMWSSTRDTLTGTSDRSIGAGKSNTDWIMATGNESQFPAAWYCANLEYNGATDWFLPSRDEIVAMRTNLGHTAFLHPDGEAYWSSYWSSTERTALDGGTDAAYYMYTTPWETSDGPAFKDNKDLYVKAARRF